MPKFDEGEAAEMLIRAHERGEFTWSSNSSRRKRAYLVVVAGMVTFLFAVGFLRVWWFFSFSLGLFIGILRRDQVYFENYKRSWAFFDRALDWQKVKSIAHGSDKDLTSVDELAM
jgi:hypothetical protein